MSFQPPTVLPTTVTQLRAVSYKQLKFWADEINRSSIAETGQKYFKSVSGNSQFLRNLLASYLSLDLTAKDPIQEDEDIKPLVDPTTLQMGRQQYDLMMAHAEQWGLNEPYNFSGMSLLFIVFNLRGEGKLTLFTLLRI